MSTAQRNNLCTFSVKARKHMLISPVVGYNKLEEISGPDKKESNLVSSVVPKITSTTCER